MLMSIRVYVNVNCIDNDIDLSSRRLWQRGHSCDDWHASSSVGDPCQERRPCGCSSGLYLELSRLHDPYPTAVQAQYHTMSGQSTHCPVRIACKILIALAASGATTFRMYVLVVIIRYKDNRRAALSSGPLRSR